MEQSYLLQLIKALRSEEHQEAQIFIASPFIQRGKQEEEAVRLFSLILEAAPDFSDECLRKERIYTLLFPDEKLIVGKLEKVMACLSGLIRTFLLFRHYFRKSNEFYQELDWAKILRKRGLESRFQQTLSRLIKIQQSSTPKDNEHYYKSFLLEYEMHDLVSYNNKKKGDLNVPNTLHKLNIYYHISRLELLNRFLLQQKVAKVEALEDINFFFKEENILLNKYVNESPLLLITEKIHLLLKTQKHNVDDFHELMDVLFEHEQHFESSLAQQFNTYLRSLSVFLVNSGYAELLPVLLRILQHNLEKGFLYYEGKISSGALANVTNVALKVKEFDWAFHFIESHKNRIIGDNESKDYYQLNLANYHFAIGNFNQAFDLIPATLQDWDYQFIARRLRLKIYYELDSDLLPYELDAFKMLVSRSSKKVSSPYFRQLQSNFINLLFQIIHSPRGDKDRAQRLLQRIESKKVVAERDWLIEKAKRLA